MSHLFPKGNSNTTFTKSARPCTTPISMCVAESLHMVELTFIQADGKRLSVIMSYEDARLLGRQLLSTNEGSE